MTRLSYLLLLAGLAFTPALIAAAPLVAWLEWRASRARRVG